MKLFLLLILAMFSSCEAQTKLPKDLPSNTEIIYISEGGFQTSNNEGELYHFTGTKSGSNLTIKFDESKPDELKKIPKLVWIFGKTLKVQTYGKNYTTNKWGVYTAIYEKCKET